MNKKEISKKFIEESKKEINKYVFEKVLEEMQLIYKEV